MATFGERFKKLRLENKLTQDKLADMFFLNKSSISRYESDKQLPESVSIQKFADYFNVSLDYLMGASDIRNHPSNKSYELTHKDKKDIAKDIEAIQTELLKKRKGEESETLLFDGEPMSDEGIDQILAALEVGMAMVKKKNKEQYGKANKK